MVEKIISIVLGVVSVALSFLGYYFAVRAKLEAAAAGAVEGAEADGKSGEEKLRDAVRTVSALVPAALKPFIREPLITRIVQAAFDKIEAYAKKQVKEKF